MRKVMNRSKKMIEKWGVIIIADGVAVSTILLIVLLQIGVIFVVNVVKSQRIEPELHHVEEVSRVI